MKKILILLLLGFLTILNFVKNENINAFYLDLVSEFATVEVNNGTIRVHGSDGNVTNTFTQTVSSARNIKVDSNGNYIIVGGGGRVVKVDSSGNNVFDISLGSFVNPSLDLDNLDNIYVATRQPSLVKLDPNGNILLTYSAPADVESVTVNANGDIFIGMTNNQIHKLNSSLQFVSSFNNGSLPIGLNSDGNRLYVGSFNSPSRVMDFNLGLIFNINHPAWRITYDDNGDIYMAHYPTAFVRAFDSNGNFKWSVQTSTSQADSLGIAVKGDHVVITGELNPRLRIRRTDNGNQVFSSNLGSSIIHGVDFVPISIQYPLQINLDSNYDPFADIVYTSDFLTTTSSIVNDILPSASSVVVSTNQSNISPFTFQHWYDLDNNNIFTTSRTFTISNPDRDFNLRAIYDLSNSIDLSLDSTLPSPPNFNVEVDTIEQQRAIINKYPFNNEEIPFAYNFTVEAPTNNIGFYNFDYWFNNNTNTVFTTSAIISLDAIENYDLTATYSLPSEYQIVLTLFSNIGDITFKLGNQPAITGSFIEVTIGQGDSWTASGPLNPDWQFQYWLDFETNNIFSTNRSFGVSNTTQNYILEATYWPIYDVNWDSQGGTLIPQQRIVSGGTINAPTSPLRPNFSFNGWALPSAPSTPIIFPQIINNNVTYQAIWLTTYQLTFNVNGGQPINPQIVIENDIPNVVTPSRFGYTFEGWFTDNITFNNSFDFNAPFTSNTTIHAKWTFGTTANAQTSLNNFLINARLDNPLAQWIIVLSLFILLNVMIFIYKGPFIVTSILNFILTAIFIILGFIPIWIIIVLFMAIFGFMILMLSGGRS